MCIKLLVKESMIAPRSAASSSTTAPRTWIVFLSLLNHLYQGKSKTHDDCNQYDYALNIHNNIRISLTIKAINQAMAHCRNTTMKAYLVPSSRLTAAMAATHGV